MVQIIRIYCPEKDRGVLNNYERTETQVIRTRYCDIHTITFKLYRYCDATSSFNGVGNFNGTTAYRIVNNNIIPNNYLISQGIHDVDWDVRDQDGDIVLSGYIQNVYSGKFTITIPQLQSGQYTLSVTYNHGSDKHSNVFPLVVTN